MDNASYQVGYGIAAEMEGRHILVGSDRFMAMSGVMMAEQTAQQQIAAHQQGFSLVYVAVDGHLGGAFELRPTVRPEVREIVAALHDLGLPLCIVSGDHEVPTRQLAADLGIDRYFAGVLPADKANLVQQMQKEGHKVCFVGDGINDAIALKTASASVSLRGATTAATDTAQIVLMDGSLRKLPALLALARDFNKSARNTMIATYGPAVFCLGGVFFLHFGIFAAIVLSNHSLLACVANAMLPALRREEPPAPQ
jgi:Cu2+-exporting ATPase